MVKYRATILARYALILTLFAPLLRAAPSQQWVEVRSPNYSVMTDGGEKRGREVALRFEQIRAVFSTVLQPNRAKAPVPLQIIAFRNNRDLRAYAPLWQGRPIELAGLFAPGQDRQFIALDLSNEQNWQAIVHEFSHQLLNADLSRVPLWLDEGFAEYYSSIRFTPNAAEIGRPAGTAMQTLQSGRMPLEQLFNVTHHDEVYNGNDERRRLFYAQSWLVVHYLLDSNMMSQTRHYVDLTNSGVATKDAIRRAFHMEPEQLESSIDLYLQSGRAAIRTVPLPQNLEHLHLSSAPMNDADARTVLADLHLHSPDYVDQAIAEYRAILNEYPEHAGAHRGLGYALLHRREFEKAGSEFRAAADNSNDPLVYYYSALATVRQSGAPLDEAVQQLAKAIRLRPDFAEAYSLLGWTLTVKGERQSAIENMRRAVELNPQNELYRSNLARCLMTDAQYDGAEALLAGLMASKNPGTATAARRDLATLNRLRRQQERSQRSPAVSEAVHPELPPQALAEND